MSSGIPQKNRTVAESYFDEHLSHNDYYTQGVSQAGHWIGTGAHQLGLQPGETVTREAFLRLCDNQHPDTGEQLTPPSNSGTAHLLRLRLLAAQVGVHPGCHDGR